MKAKYYHNPKCSTSRSAKVMLEEANVELEVIDYLKKPLEKKDIKRIAEKMEDSSQLLREKEPLAKELDIIGGSEEEIIAAIAKHPILLNRPIIEMLDRAIALRPFKQIQNFLPNIKTSKK